LKNYKKAQYDFLYSFQSYSEKGDKESAINMLKYALISNIIACDEIDMSDSKEVSVFKEDVLEIVQLKKLFKNMDVKRFIHKIELLKNNPKYNNFKEMLDDCKLELFKWTITKMSKNFTNFNIIQLFNLFELKTQEEQTK